MGLKAAVQALKKAEELKARVSKHSDLLNNSEAWSDQQQLQTVYHQVLVLDLEYALDKKVEQELWTLGFKNHIAALQHLSRDKKNPRRSECQALLSWCLEAASGFYLTLLQELCSTFDLDLPFRRRSAIYGQTKPWPNSEQLTQPHKTSCLYICQYCLVHLGDIARYRSQRKQAESFYRHAILLSPSSGQPYNQLALLEASRGDKLATVFHYVRSISVKHPFPAAATNLANTLSAMVDNNDPWIEVHSKLSLNEFITIFLRVHGLLHSLTDLDQAEMYVKTLNATFTALVATQVFSSMKLIQMTAINLYALRHTVDSLSINQLTQDEMKVKHLVLDLLAGAFSAYLLPIYTMNDSHTLLDYYALPAIKLTIDWIKTDSTVLGDEVFIKRLQIWPSLCKLLNCLQMNICDLDMIKHNKVPLPEDRDLQSFLPLTNAFKELDFGSENMCPDVSFYNKLRTTRLVALGTWLCTQSVNENVVMTCKTVANSRNILFEPANKQPDPTTELLEELKFFNIKDNIDTISKVKGTEKRGGILKPQGSLEKSREEREQALLLSSENDNSSGNTSLSNSSVCSIRSDTSKSKRPRQNVAMQALTKKVEENNKQVTFQTEPVIKSIEKPQLKNHEMKPLPDIPLESIHPKEPLLHVPINPILQVPIGSNPNEIMPNQGFQNTNSAVQLARAYNQTQNYPRININVSNIPFSVQYPNSTTNLLYHNNIQQSPNVQYPRQPQFSTAPNNGNGIRPPPQGTGFNLGYDRSIPVTQPIGYQSTPSQLPPKDPFTPWLHDDKLPMPPSTWWSSNQKPIPPQTYPSSQHDPYKQTYPFPMNPVGNTNMNFMPDSLKTNGMDYGMQYNAGMGNGSAYSSVWSSSPNVQPNMQMLMNQSGPPLIQSAQPKHQSVFNDVNKMPSISRETNLLGVRETNDSQTNSMPGYSLFNSNWAPNLVHSALQSSPPDRPPLIRQQSLFSSSGPSPLERLLEQQKQLRGGSKEDT